MAVNGNNLRVFVASSSIYDCIGHFRVLCICLMLYLHCRKAVSLPPNDTACTMAFASELPALFGRLTTTHHTHHFCPRVSQVSEAPLHTNEDWRYTDRETTAHAYSFLQSLLNCFKCKQHNMKNLMLTFKHWL